MEHYLNAPGPAAVKAWLLWAQVVFTFFGWFSEAVSSLIHLPAKALYIQSHQQNVPLYFICMPTNKVNDSSTTMTTVQGALPKVEAFLFCPQGGAIFQR